VTVLSYQSIRRRFAARDASRIVVTPKYPGMIQPASFDVQLGEELWTWSESYKEWHNTPLSGHGCWYLEPERFYLGVLRQFIRVP
jgi:deoxycytidine triphosphate deaminase